MDERTVEIDSKTWRLEIKYGPEDEANYAFVFDASGALVSNLKIHHAHAVVDAMNRTSKLAAVEDEISTLRMEDVVSLRRIEELKNEIAIERSENKTLREKVDAFLCAVEYKPGYSPVVPTYIHDAILDLRAALSNQPTLSKDNDHA